METYLTQLYKKQISLTEWFEAIGDARAAKLRAEDAGKHDRLDILNRIIGLPFGKPVRFPALAAAKRSADFKKYLKEHGHEECAIRLLPRRPELPKLRIRGYTITRALEWFDEQAINPADYEVDFVPHDHPTWATIFTVNDKGIFGEVKRGDPSQLTQGMYSQTDDVPTTFSYDFTNWHFSNELAGATDHVKELVNKIHIPSIVKKNQLSKELGSMFTHDYLKGYFETSTSKEFGVWFIDYNRLLGDIYTAAPITKTSNNALVTGRCGSPGKATGVVRIVQPNDLETTKLGKNDILVCPMTTPDYLPLMQQAAAIVTDLGGVLSHAAIIARELKKPCLTGTKNATEILQNGQEVEVDATKGIVTSYT
jgi:phosphohistidine swiveling domain-containing protein